MQKLIVWIPLFCWGLFSFSNAHAQLDPSMFMNAAGGKTGTIKGSIIDAKSKKPLEFATVSIYTPQDSLIGGGITDKYGEFEVKNLDFGQYYAKIAFMGYVNRKMDELTIDSTQKVIQLKKISLEAADSEQEAVEVVAEKSLFQLGLDKKVFNVEKSDLANSENATEVLRGTPGVVIDKDEQVKVRGKAVQVYINGKPTGLTGENQASILRQIPANTIKSIELITNPSAKEEPDGGASGIINIVMKKNPLQGFTGSVRGSAGTNSRFFRTPSDGPLFNKYGTGLSLNYKSDKINFFSNISLNTNNSFWESNSSRHEFYSDTSFYLNTQNLNEYGYGSLWGRIGLDYYFNDFQSISFQVRNSSNMNPSSNVIQFDNFDQDSVLQNRQERISDRISNRQNWTYTAVYSIIFPEKDSLGDPITDNIGAMGEHRELVFDFQYSNNNGNEFSELYTQTFDQRGILMEIPLDSQNINTLTGMRGFNAKADYTHPFKKSKSKLEVGYHYRYQLDSRDFQYEDYDPLTEMLVNDTARSNYFDYQQQIHAVYGTYTTKLGEKWSGKLGLRLEQVFVASYLRNTDKTFTLNYFQFYPTAHFSYQMDQKQQMTFSFSRRVNRPWLWSLNPFPNYSNPRSLSKGNPYLLPTFTNNIDINYGRYWGQNSVSIGLFSNLSNNEQTRIQTVDDEGVVVTTPQNLGYESRTGFDFSGNFKLTKFWSVNAGGNFYHAFFNADKFDEDLTYSTLGTSSNIYNNLRFKFGLSISLGGSIWYNFRTIQGRTLPGVWHWLSASQSLFNRKLRISLWMQNPFIVNRWRTYTETENFTAYSESLGEIRSVRLSVSYNFGKVKLKKPRRSRLQSRTGGGSSGGGGGGQPGGQ